MITAVVVVLTFLNSWGTDGTFGHQDSEDSVLSAIGKTIVPAFEPMGITPANWPLLSASSRAFWRRSP